MAAASIMETHQEHTVRRLNLLMERFPRGLSLGREDLALIGWLYFYEMETGSQGISEAQLKWLIPEAAKYLDLNEQSQQPTLFVQRLMRFGILRATVADRKKQGYKLTRLGLSLARDLVEDIDYGSEQLDVLLGSALKEVESAIAGGDDAFLKYLKHVLLGTIQEKIEYKLLAIDEDLQERKKTVRRTYSGQDQGVFEKAIKDIEHCRIALTELVDAVRESSACVRLEKELHERIGQGPQPGLYDTLEQSLTFIYNLRVRVDAMLKDVVQFIHDCVAYRSLAFTVDSRERLRRVQELFLTHALHHVVRMPVLDAGRLPRLDLNWSRQERQRIVVLDMDMIKTVEGFSPPDVPLAEPEWKEPFLQMARTEWMELSKKSGVDLGAWLASLREKLPQIDDNPCLAVWFLTQDWPKWNPSVSAESQTGRWIPLGKEWLMEDVRLEKRRRGKGKGLKAKG